MNPDNLIKVINGVGFPIVMCLALYYTNTFMLNKQSELLTEFKDAVVTNTLAVERRNTRAEYVITKIENIELKLEKMQCLP